MLRRKGFPVEVLNFNLAQFQVLGVMTMYGRSGLMSTTGLNGDKYIFLTALANNDVILG